MCSVLVAIARFYSQLVKQRPKKRVAIVLVSLPSRFITGLSGQVFQSSVRGRHGYNLKSVDTVDRK